MAIVDSPNPWVLARVATRSGAGSAAAEVCWDAAGLQFVDGRGAWTANWLEVSELLLYTREQLVGQVICLRLAFRDGRFVEFNETMPAWPALVRELPAHLRLNRPLDQALPVLASNPAVQLRLLAN